MISHIGGDTFAVWILLSEKSVTVVPMGGKNSSVIQYVLTCIQKDI